MLSYGSAFWPEFWAIIGGGAALTVAVLTLASIVIRRRQQPAPAIAVPVPAATVPAAMGHTDVAGDLPAAA